MPQGQEIARKIIAHLTSTGCDPTLLFYLRNPLSLKGTFLGPELNEMLCKAVKLSTLDFLPTHSNTEFLKDFFTTVREHFTETGIHPIQPTHFIVEKNAGGKHRLIHRYLTESTSAWPSPKQPYCIQTMGGGDVLFMIFQTWQDALIMQRDILKMGGYTLKGQFIPVLQVLEHQWQELRIPSRLIIDWEIMASHYEDRLSRQEILDIPMKFPAWLISRLREIRALDKNTPVECIVKNKTRPKGQGDLKVSCHFTFNIISLQLTGHFPALTEVIQPFTDQIKDYHRDKLLTKVPDDLLSHPVWGWDNRLLRGQNGIGTLFGKKPGDSPDVLPPSVTHKIILHPGGRQDIQALAWKDKVNSIQVLGDEQSLIALYKCSYTPPQAGMITYDPCYFKVIYTHFKKLTLESRTPRCSHSF